MGVSNVSSIATDNSTATSTAAAATVNAQAGMITTEALTTAAGATYTFTLTSNRISANSAVMFCIAKGTATTGTPVVAWTTPAAGSVVVIIQNIHASAALNGTILLGFYIVNPAL